MKKSQLEYAKQSKTIAKTRSPTQKLQSKKSMDPDLISEFDKSPVSDRSGNSPGGAKSPKSISSPQPMSQFGGRYNKKRNTAIVSSQQLAQMHDRSVIKLLGLNMEAVCPREGHEKNKVQFMCQYPECSQEIRLGCAHCQLQFHGDHPTYSMSLQAFCKFFDEKYKEFQNEISTLMAPIEKETYIKDYFKKLRDFVNLRLAEVEEHITGTVNKFIAFEPQQYSLINHVDYLAKKNLFEMTSKEVEESLQFVQGQHLQKLQSIAASQNAFIQERNQMAEAAFNTYFSQLESDVHQAFDDNLVIFFIDQKSKDYAELKLEYFQKKEQRIQDQSEPFKQIIEQYRQQEEQERLKLLLLQQELQIKMIQDELDTNTSSSLKKISDNQKVQNKVYDDEMLLEDDTKINSQAEYRRSTSPNRFSLEPTQTPNFTQQQIFPQQFTAQNVQPRQVQSVTNNAYSFHQEQEQQQKQNGQQTLNKIPEGNPQKSIEVTLQTRKLHTPQPTFDAEVIQVQSLIKQTQSPKSNVQPKNQQLRKQSEEQQSTQHYVSQPKSKQIQSPTQSFNESQQSPTRSYSTSAQLHKSQSSSQYQNKIKQ